MNHDPNSLRVRVIQWRNPVPNNFDILIARLVELQKPFVLWEADLSASVLAKHGRHREIELRVRQVNAYASSGAARERHEVIVEGRVVDPSLRAEHHGILKVGGRVVDQQTSHGERDTGTKHILLLDDGV